jgi:CcmD family protein
MPKNFIYVVSAYGAIWVAILVYLIVLGSRLTKVEQQLTLLKKK